MRCLIVFQQFFCYFNTALEDKLDRCETFQALLITRTCYEEKAYFVKLNQNQVSTGKRKLREKRADKYFYRIFLSSTINGYFGSGIMTHSGIILNNQMADFSIPGVQNVQGAGPPTVRNPPLARVSS